MQPNKRSKVASAPQRSSVIAQLVSSEGEAASTGQLDLPVEFDPEQLQVLLNELLGNEEPLPYSFYIEEKEVLSR